MKPFRFPLQAVLTVRANQENKALEAFVRAQADFEKIAARHREIQREIEAVLHSRRDVLSKTVTSDEVQRMQQGLRLLQEVLRRCQSEMERAQTILEEKSRTLLQARQKREVVEKLQEKQLAGHVAKAAKVEQKMVDDFATLKSIGKFALKWK